MIAARIGPAKDTCPTLARNEMAINSGVVLDTTTGFVPHDDYDYDYTSDHDDDDDDGG